MYIGDSSEFLAIVCCLLGRQLGGKKFIFCRASVREQDYAATSMHGNELALRK